MYKILIKLNLTLMSVVIMNELIRCKKNQALDDIPLTTMVRRLAKYGNCKYDFTYYIGNHIGENNDN